MGRVSDMSLAVPLDADDDLGVLLLLVAPDRAARGELAAEDRGKGRCCVAPQQIPDGDLSFAAKEGGAHKRRGVAKRHASG